MSEPMATGDDAKGGWKIATERLDGIRKKIEASGWESPPWEVIEMILLEAHPAPSPSGYDPATVEALRKAVEKALIYYDALDRVHDEGEALVLDTLANAASALLDEEVWQPIETAPKDGTTILLFSVPDEVDTLPPHIAGGYWRAASNFMAPGIWCFVHSVGPSFQPTHWMPLPEAPRALTDEEAGRACMSESKHTPGPWTVDGPPHNQIVWSSAENRVCFLAHSNGRDDERDIATGRLIAAAPDLLEALKVLVKQDLNVVTGRGFEMPALGAAIAAITKADPPHD